MPVNLMDACFTRIDELNAAWQERAERALASVSMIAAAQAAKTEEFKDAGSVAAARPRATEGAEIRRFAAALSAGKVAAGGRAA